MVRQTACLDGRVSGDETGTNAVRTLRPRISAARPDQTSLPAAREGRYARPCRADLPPMPRNGPRDIYQRHACGAVSDDRETSRSAGTNGVRKMGAQTTRVAAKAY